jgi:hypothetical protein
MALTTLCVHWSELLDLISGMQELLPNKPKASSHYTLPTYQEIGTQKSQHQRTSISRRNVLVSIATGVTTSLPLLNNYFDSIVANAATTPTAAFRAYQVQPDSGEKLNPTLATLTVRATFLVDC